jgi:hypothetical protein
MVESEEIRAHRRRGSRVMAYLPLVRRKSAGATGTAAAKAGASRISALLELRKPLWRR